jgi:hypothetical protein
VFDMGETECGITEDIIPGCTYSSSCNEDENANYDDGSCWWESYGCDCGDGQDAFADMCGTCDNNTTNNCTEDCLGEWGGDAVEDGCGVCGGDGSSCNGCPYEIDCNDVCGGNAVVDNCGVCNGSNECLIEAPEGFSFNQSSAQAFYFVLSATDLFGDPLVAGDDWIGLFNGDICVGSRQWPGEAVDIAAMGDDGCDYSAGYLQSGDTPTFHIYDASENA